MGQIRERGRKGALTALRDAALLKTVYAYGLRRREAYGLDLADRRHSPTAAQYGRYGAWFVRWGKASKGGPPKRRTVLTVPEMDWIVEVLEHWVTEVRPLLRPGPLAAVWVNERAGRMSMRSINEAFASARQAAGLPTELDLHCLRHSYVTHLVEFDYPERFVSEQVGHRYASTTALYTGVSDEYRRRLIRRACRTVPNCGSSADDQEDGLPLESAQTHGRAGHVRHHRPGAAVGRAWHPPLARAGLPAGHRTPTATVDGHPRRPVRHPRLHPERSDRDRCGQHPRRQDRRPGRTSCPAAGSAHHHPPAEVDMTAARAAGNGRQDGTRRVAARLCTVVPDLDPTAATRFVGRATVAHTLRRLETHLAEHPDALISGSSDAPIAVQRLAGLLADAGHTTVVVPVACAAVSSCCCRTSSTAAESATTAAASTIAHPADGAGTIARSPPTPTVVIPCAARVSPADANPAAPADGCCGCRLGAPTVRGVPQLLSRPAAALLSLRAHRLDLRPHRRRSDLQVLLPPAPAPLRRLR